MHFSYIELLNAVGHPVSKYVMPLSPKRCLRYDAAYKANLHAQYSPVIKLFEKSEYLSFFHRVAFPQNPKGSDDKSLQRFGTAFPGIGN